MKKPLNNIKIQNPVAKAMLLNRRAPQVVPAKKGRKAKYNRQESKKLLTAFS
jgi:ribosomal protein L39E